MGKLDGQVAIVFGASSGMGRATAAAFAAEGAVVVAAARRATELASLASTAGAGLITPVVADIATRDQVDDVVKMTVARFGRLDTVVNAAGINTPNRKLTTLDHASWDKIIAVNLTGAYNVTQSVLPRMREQHNGLIVHISSISGKWGDFSGAAYQASKHGLVGLAYATMAEERLNGIRVTVIFPGLCDTSLLNNRPVPPTQELRDQMMKPEDIAAGALFVASLPARTYVPELVMMPGALQCVGIAAL